LVVSHGGNVNEKLSGKYPERDVTYKATDYTKEERFNAKYPAANKRKARKKDT
jgi:hypothetical protein